MSISGGRGLPAGQQSRVPQMWSSVPEDMMVPDATLPSQFYDIWHHSRAIRPERALALAVLEQAVLDLEKHRFAVRRRYQRFYMEAYKWVTSGDRAWPYSFVNLCESLDIEPGALCMRLLGEAAPPRLSERLGHLEVEQEQAA